MKYKSNVLSILHNKHSSISYTIARLSVYSTLFRSSDPTEKDKAKLRYCLTLPDSMDFMVLSSFRKMMLKMNPARIFRISKRKAYAKECLECIKDKVSNINSKYITNSDLSYGFEYIANKTNIPHVYYWRRYKCFHNLKYHLKMLREKDIKETHMTKTAKNGDILRIPCIRISKSYKQKATELRKQAHRRYNEIIRKAEEKLKIPRDFNGDNKTLIFVPKQPLHNTALISASHIVPLTKKRLLWHINRMIKIYNIVFE